MTWFTRRVSAYFARRHSVCSAKKIGQPLAAWLKKHIDSAYTCLPSSDGSCSAM